MAQRGGTLSSTSSTARTCPVTVDPSDRTVAGLPLNCAIRKRRTSFWSAVSNVNMELSLLYPDAADLVLAHGGQHFPLARNFRPKSGSRLVDLLGPAFRSSNSWLGNGRELRRV